MTFKTFPGIEGKVYVPDVDDREKKHACPDCFACQRCRDDRCRLCLTDSAVRATGPLFHCSCKEGAAGRLGDRQ